MSEGEARQPVTIESFDALCGADTDDILGFTHVCIACGYNLRGLAIRAKCPECNKRVSESLSKQYLHNADRKWVRAMRRGAMLLTINTILPFAVFCLFLPFMFMARAAFSQMPGGRVVGVFLLAIIPFLLVLSVWLTYLLGWIQLTKREPGTQPTTDANAARSRCRSWSIIAAILLPVLLIVGVFRIGSGIFTGGAGITPTRDLIEVMFLSISPSVVLVIQFWFVTRHVRILCGRLLANGLAVYALVLFWIVVAVSVLGTGRSVMQYYSTRQMMSQIQTMVMNMPQTAPGTNPGTVQNNAPGISSISQTGAPPGGPSGSPTGTPPGNAAAGVQGGASGGAPAHHAISAYPQGAPQFPSNTFGPLFFVGAIIGAIHSLLSFAMYGMYVGFCAWLWAKLSKAARPAGASG